MLDVLGTIYTPGQYDDQGEIITPPEPLPGYHVNAVCSIPAFTPYVIDTPSHPARLFGDVEHTVFLRFADRAEWLSLGIEYTDDEGQQAFDTTALQAELDKLRWRKTAIVSRAKARIFLKSVTLSDDPRTLFQRIQDWTESEDAPMAASEYWEEAYEFSRGSQLIEGFGPLLGFTPEQIDDFFLGAQAVPE